VQRAPVRRSVAGTAVLVAAALSLAVVGFVLNSRAGRVRPTPGSQTTLGFVPDCPMNGGVFLTTTPNGLVSVPDVRGMPVCDAQRALTQAGVEGVIVSSAVAEPGRLDQRPVRQQSPAPGASVRLNAWVHLRLGAFEPRTPVLEVLVLPTLTYQSSEFQLPAGRIKLEFKSESGNAALIFRGPHLTPSLQKTILSVAAGKVTSRVLRITPGSYTIESAFPGTAAAGERAQLVVTPREGGSRNRLLQRIRRPLQIELVNAQRLVSPIYIG
jgi:hypothetical protein